MLLETLTFNIVKKQMVETGPLLKITYSVRLACLNWSLSCIINLLTYLYFTDIRFIFSLAFAKHVFLRAAMFFFASGLGLRKGINHVWKILFCKMSFVVFNIYLFETVLKVCDTEIGSSSLTLK